MTLEEQAAYVAMLEAEKQAKIDESIANKTAIGKTSLSGVPMTAEEKSRVRKNPCRVTESRTCRQDRIIVNYGSLLSYLRVAFLLLQIIGLIRAETPTSIADLR
ncbi:MAG: hypothetical protein H6765_10040 [Candidatus Peribacteria bacterium]|nr:MAG: hypothetical protein H6765_10040 [Candidatus Peribacteria bacterium]